jgi:excisionase family DNA binding protein
MAELKQAENWVSMKDITKYLDVSRETVLQWISNRNMPASKVGRLWKFKISEVDAWIRSGGAADKSES